MRGYFWLDLLVGLIRRAVLRPIEVAGRAQEVDYGNAATDED